MTATTTQTIGYDAVGAGEPAVLMLPGWCGDRVVFDELLALLAPYRLAIAADLPEQGTSVRTGDDFDTGTVVDEMVALIEAIGTQRVVPVALAHAGWVAIELRRRLGPERIPAIVLLDWMVLGPPPGFTDALAGLQEEHACDQVRAALFAMWTSGVDVPELHDYVSSMGDYDFAHWRRAGREIAAAFAREGSPLAALEQLNESCPTLHVYAQPADDGFLVAQQAYAASHDWFRVHRLDALSHFPMFEVPGEMVRVIEEFVCSNG